MRNRPADETGAAVLGGFSPIRVQNSRPGAPVTIYLDFDGEAPFYWQVGSNNYLVNGPGGPSDWVPGFSLDANTNSFTPAELDGIDAIWAQTAEKFSPFNINVTTVRPGSFNDAEAIHMIIGGSDRDWYNPTPRAGGVAPFEGFTRSELPNEGFAFSADAIGANSVTLSEGDRHFIAETVAHEAGHLFGLHHQSVVNGNTVVTVYSPGDAITAPIMGGSSNNGTKRGIWFNGLTSTTDSNGNTVPVGPQDDLAVMTRGGTNIAYRTDDFGSFSGSGALAVDSQTGLVSGAGVIERVGDQDAFTFVATGPVLSFTVNQFQSAIPLGAPATLFSGMLAPTLELIPISGSAPAVSVNPTNTSATLTATGVTPGQGFVLRVSPQGNAYGSVGQYTIAGNVGTFASMSGGTLVVNGYNVANDIKISYNSSTNNIVLQNNVFGGTAVQQFPRGPVTGILVNGQDGDDTIDIFGQFSSLNIPVTVNGGLGIDTLVLQGTTGNDYQALTPGRGFISNNTPGSYNSVEKAILTGFDGADTIEIYETAAALSTTLYGGNHNDVLTVGAAPFAGSLVQGSVDVLGDAGGDTLRIGSDNGDAVLSHVTFNGGTGAGVDEIVYNDTAPTYRVNYDISSTGINRHGFGAPVLMSYSNVSSIVIHGGSGGDNVNVRNGVTATLNVFGNGGNDNFTVGGGNLAGTFGHNFVGGPGTDQITFDDHLATTARLWEIRPNEVIFDGLIPLSTSGFESVGVLAGTGGDEITFVGAIEKHLNINGGDGFDRFIWNNATNRYPTNPEQYVVDLHGGGDQLNSLAISSAITGPMTFNVLANRIVGQADPFAIFTGTPDVNYANFIAVSVTTGPQADRFNVYSTDAGSNYNLNGGDGADYFYMQTDPATRNNVTLNGQAGNDTLAVDDSVFDNADVPYSTVPGSGIFPDRVVRNTGLPVTTYGYTSMQSMILGGTTGDNTFNIDAFNPNGPLAVYGWGGNDTLNVAGAVIRLFPSNSLTFHGGDDYDTFNMLDATAGSTAYFVFEAVLRRNSTDVPLTTTERLNIAAGPLVDHLTIHSQAPGQLIDFAGGDGDDQFFTGGNSAEGVRGPVYFNGEGGADNRITINDTLDTSGDTFHIDQSSISAFTDDNLFGDGGLIAFSGVQQIDVNCGSGLDAPFVQPNAVATINLDLGAQTGSRGGAGDALSLALAGAVNPVITPGAAGAGVVTSDNLQPLNYSGVEEGPFVDDVAPEVLGSSFELNVPAQAITVSFSEDVSGTLLAGSFTLMNLTTNEPVASTDVALSYDTSTNIATLTFPNLTHGVLPDGNYQLTLPAGAVTDAFGNPSQADHTLDFFFLNGDANHDGRVNLSDFNALAANFGQSNRAFSEGDFTYDGVVNLSDFNILASRFGMVLGGGARSTLNGVRDQKLVDDLRDQLT